MDFNCPMRSGMAPVFHLVFATDIDGDGHTMVGLNGKIVFDPNPSQPDLVTASPTAHREAETAKAHRG